MRRWLIVLGLVGALVASVVPSQAVDIGEQFSCSSTTGATITGLTGQQPTCSFDLLCVGFCVYLVRLDSSGVGLVSGTMSADVTAGNGQATFFHDDDNDGTIEPGEAPSCSGLFRCSAPEGDDDTLLFVATEDPFASAVVTVRCTGGGLAAGETIWCSATSVEFQDFPNGPPNGPN